MHFCTTTLQSLQTNQKQPSKGNINERHQSFLFGCIYFLLNHLNDNDSSSLLKCSDSESPTQHDKSQVFGLTGSVVLQISDSDWV